MLRARDGPTEKEPSNLTQSRSARNGTGPVAALRTCVDAPRIEYAVNGRKADEVAQQFGLTRNQVYLARSRIRHRLKCELDGLLEDD